jgi:hypothetical protein
MRGETQVPPLKPIRLSGHARKQLQFLGATEQEVIETIRTEQWGPEGEAR